MTSWQCEWHPIFIFILTVDGRSFTSSHRALFISFTWALYVLIEQYELCCTPRNDFACDPFAQMGEPREDERR